MARRPINEYLKFVTKGKNGETETAIPSRRLIALDGYNDGDTLAKNTFNPGTPEMKEKVRIYVFDDKIPVLDKDEKPMVDANKRPVTFAGILSEPVTWTDKNTGEVITKNKAVYFTVDYARVSPTKWTKLNENEVPQISYPLYSCTVTESEGTKSYTYKDSGTYVHVLKKDYEHEAYGIRIVKGEEELRRYSGGQSFVVTDEELQTMNAQEGVAVPA